MSAPTRLSASLLVLGVSFGCNAMFDIERGTVRDDAEAGSGGVSTTGGKGGAGGKGGNGGKGGASGSDMGGNGGSNGGSDTGAGGSNGGNGGNGGSTGGSGGSMGGKGGGGGASGSSAGGGAGTSGGTAGSAGAEPIPDADCMCSSLTPSDPELIHDFESGNVALLTRDGRNGSFYSFASEAEYSAEFVCSGDDANCTSLCMMGTLNGSNYPFAGLGLVLAQVGGMPQPYDATVYDGVSFKIRGEFSDEARFRIEIPTVSTQPLRYAGTCDENEGTCVDHYKHYFARPTSLDAFETYEVRFVSLGQGEGGGGWTAPWDGNVAFAWDPSELLNMSFMVAANQQSVSDAPFHVCIDDVRFLTPRSRTRVHTFNFEMGTGEVGNVDGLTVAHDQTEAAVGMGSVRADISSPVGDSCGGFVQCGNYDSEAACTAITGCVWSGTSCSGTPADCGTLSATQCTAETGCHLIAKPLFAVDDTLNDIDIQAGDTLAFWMRLPQDEVDWMHMFISGGDQNTWTTFQMAGALRRDEWFYVEFVVPEGIPQPTHQWGFQFAVPETFEGSVYVDDMVVYR